MALDKKQFAWLTDIRFIAFLAGLVTFLVYLPALENGFVSWDDDTYLYKNDHIRHLNGEFFRWAFSEFRNSNWHPLTWISHALDYAVWGLDPMGHHLTNNVLHSANTLLVTLFCFQLLRGFQAPGQSLVTNDKNLQIVALIAGLLFGLHPLHVESAAWISERKDLLCAFFYLLSLLFYLRIWRKSPAGPKAGDIYRNKDYLFCLLLFVMALMSKPMAISLPFVLLLIDWMYGEGLSRRAWRDSLIAKIPFFGLALGSAIVTIAAQKAGGAISTLTTAPFIDRLWVASYALIAYLKNMLWPFDLLPFYTYPTSVQWLSFQYLGSASLVIVITIAAVLNIRRHRALAAAWGYYVVTLIPVLGIVKVGGQAMADRYTYLPSIAPFLLLAVVLVWGLCRLQMRDEQVKLRLVSLSILTLSLTAALTVLTHKQIKIWESGETLWRYEIQYDDRVPLAYKQLAIALFEQAEYKEAAIMTQKALSLLPLNVELLSNLAICHLELGDLDNAMQATLSALNLDANNLHALNTLGEIHLAHEEYTKANQVFFQAWQLEPDKPLRLFNLAVSFDKLNDAPQSCLYWRRFMSVDVSEAYDAEIIEHLAEIGCPVTRP